VWWYTSIVPALKSLRQEDREFKVSLDYGARSCLSFPPQRPPSRPHTHRKSHKPLQLWAMCCVIIFKFILYWCGPRQQAEVCVGSCILSVSCTTFDGLLDAFYANTLWFQKSYWGHRVQDGFWDICQVAATGIEAWGVENLSQGVGSGDGRVQMDTKTIWRKDQHNWMTNGRSAWRPWVKEDL
jgi:hypothetical protein